MERGGAGSFGADPFGELKDDTSGYTVYDSHYEKIGKVDDLVVDEADRVLYVGVKLGLFGTSSTLVPTEILRVNDRRRLIEVSEPAETVKHAPRFGTSEDLTPELENHVRTYYGLEGLRPSPEHEDRAEGTGMGAISPSPEAPEPDDLVDVSPGERLEAQDRYTAEQPMDRSPEERSTEERPTEERPIEERPPRGRPREEEPVAEREGRRESISEPLSEPKSLGEQLSGGGRVTVHRLRR